MTKGILYYSDNCIRIRLAKMCRKQIASIGLPITSVTLKPIEFGNNICLNLERGRLTMFKQILTGLEAMKEDIVFHCEHDVLYHPSHFEFTPERDDVFYYNENNWRIREDGFAVYFDHDSTSQLCAYRELLIEEYSERVRKIEEEGWHNNGYEPGTRSIARGGFSDRSAARWRSAYPNLDIRHDNNLTANRWSVDKFRDKSTCQNWQESTVDKLPGWEGLNWSMPQPISIKRKQSTNSKKYRRDLSILIPARNEMFLVRTINDILQHKRGNTEIVVGLDGSWPVGEGIADHPDVSIYHTSVPIGQRAMTNRCASLTNSRYLMKVDAHCAFDEGFDVKLMEHMEDDWTVVPIMRNLWAFDWQCNKCGNRTYQGPTPTSCKKCDNTEDFQRVIVWEGKTNPQSKSYCFDTEPHFQYFREYSQRPEGKGELTETMSLQGSCFMLTSDRYWKLKICDEELFGSWGSQGIEVAVKSWLSGGRVLVNHSTWYAHMFRTQGGDFGFPYPNPASSVQATKKKARELFFGNKWEGAIHPLSWLVEKFWPVPGWDAASLDELKEIERSSSLSVSG